MWPDDLIEFDGNCQFDMLPNCATLILPRANSCRQRHLFQFAKYSIFEMAGPNVLVILAEGAEEMETVISVDVLRRASAKVTVAGLSGNGEVTCSRQVVIKPDCSLEEALKQRPFKAVLLPGGLKGAEHLASSELVGRILKEQEDQGRIIAAICAAPTALKKHGIGKGKKITSYPSTKSVMDADSIYQYLEDRVVVDGNIITSRGPGTAFEFALTVAKQLGLGDKVPELKKGMLLQ